MLLNIVEKSAPAHTDAPSVNKLLLLTELWDTHVGKMRYADDGDLEDFLEQAVRLQSVLFNVEDVWLTVNAGSTAKNLRTGVEASVKDLSDHVRYGVQSTADIALSDLPQLKMEASVDRYTAWKTFQDNSLRTIIHAGYNPSEGVSLTEAVLQLHQQGHREVFIKAVRAKTGFWKFPLPEVMTEKEASNLIEENLEWATIRMEGTPDAFTVQSSVRMMYEYRFFVVNHQPVTGAGMVAEFTPFNNTAASPFNAYMRAERGKEVSFQPELMEKYLRFVDKIADEMKQENPELHSYVVDVAINPEEETLVVEFNSLLNSGLYASNPDYVVIALNSL